MIYSTSSKGTNLENTPLGNNQYNHSSSNTNELFPAIVDSITNSSSIATMLIISKNSSTKTTTKCPLRVSLHNTVRNSNSNSSSKIVNSNPIPLMTNCKTTPSIRSQFLKNTNKKSRMSCSKTEMQPTKSTVNLT